MRRTSEVVVVGAGIVGAACARALARAGFEVLVVDETVPGGGTTAAGMGHVVVMDDSDAQMRLTSLGRELWHQLLSELDAASTARAEVDRAGTLWVAEDEADLQVVRDKYAYYSEHGVRAEILDENALKDAEPELRDGLPGALRVPDDLVVYAPSVVDVLMRDAIADGARFELARATRVVPRRVELEGERAIEAEHVVNAAGEGALALLDATARDGIAVRRRKGQLAITDRYPGFARHQLVELGYLKSAHGDAKASVAFNLQPRKTGQMLLGSSREFEARGSEIDGGLLQSMIARAECFMPRIASLQVLRCWAGFRVATSDNLPLIGPVASDEGLLLACGHEGLGITTSLSTAELLAARLRGEEAPIDNRPYLPSRFAQSSS